ncbi:MAG: hypothetical protein OEM15_03550 [Myxococcales bacterium]|nr:hypothetical protein [Myxococcales bacterium]MDH3485837.1 hypothetical protein [Myxococcales bacterium]
MIDTAPNVEWPASGFRAHLDADLYVAHTLPAWRSTEHKKVTIV